MAKRTVLQYQLIEQIGEGGMGIVWKAHDSSLDRPVALKFLHASTAADPVVRERLIREARSASALNHPNIVTIYEINFDGEQPFIAMELIRGRSLAEMLRERKWLPAGRTVDYALQLCAGLGVAHRAGIVHRDIKPSNIMLTAEDGIVKILDFGVAKWARGRGSSAADAASASRRDPPLSAVGAVIGTVPYMSPEQAAGDPVDSRSDVFSVGIVLYEMLSGRRPFQGSSNSAIIQALLLVDFPPLSSLPVDVPEPLVRIVHRCLQKCPEARYKDAGEMARQLRDLDHPAAASSSSSSWWPESQSEVPTVSIVNRGGAGPRWRRRGSKLLVAAGLVALATATLSVVVWQWAPFATTTTGHGGKLSTSGSTAAVAAIVQARTDALLRAQSSLQRYDRKGSVDSAIAELESASRSPRGGGAAIHAALAEAYVRKHNESADRQWLPRALESGRRAVAITDDLAAGHAALGMALAASGQKKAEAIAEFERARDLNPLNGAAHVGLAKLGSGKEAEALFRKAIALSPGQWIPLNELAAFFYRQARYDEGIALWREALASSHDNVVVIRNLAAGLHMKGRYAEAADQLQGALGLDDSTATTWANLGTARYFQGRYSDAARAAEKAVELAPNRYLYWGNLGDDYRSAGGALKGKAPAAFQTAIRLARERLAQAPGDAPVRSSLAVYLAKSGDASGALAELALLMSQNSGGGGGGDAGEFFKSALVYEITGNRDKALGALERAIRAGYSMHEVGNEPELALLRSDSRYESIAAQSDVRN